MDLLAILAGDEPESGLRAGVVKTIGSSSSDGRHEFPSDFAVSTDGKTGVRGLGPGVMRRRAR